MCPDLRSKKKSKKPSIWTTEIKVRREKETKALKRLIELVKKYEDLS